MQVKSIKVATRLFILVTLVCGSATAEVRISGGECATSTLCSLFGDARAEGGFLVCQGGGATFAGTGGFVVGDEALTMSATVRIRRPSGREEGDGVMFFSKGDEWMFGRGKNGELIFWIKAAPGDMRQVTGGKTPSVGIWTHYAARVTRVNRPEKGDHGYFVELFVNGEQVASRELLHFTAQTAKNDVCFGQGPEAARWRFCGDMSDVRLWNRALSDDEIEKDAISTGRVKVAGVAKCELTPEFTSSIEGLSGADSGWLRQALKRAAEGGADQTVLAKGVAQGGSGIWKVFEFPRSKVLVLLKGAGRSFPLAGFLDRRTGRETFGRRTFGWRIDTAIAADFDSHLDTDDGWTREVTCEENGFKATWKRDSLNVGMRFTLSDGRIESHMEVNNSDGRLRLRNVTCAAASFARLPGRDRLLLPFMGGVEHFNPVEKVSEFAKQDSIYPCGSMTLPMGAYYNDAGGVCYIAEDSTASAKRITAFGRRGGIDVSFSQDVAIDAGAKGGNSYRQPGILAVELFEGDWFDAGQIYKRFLSTKAPWWVANLPRTETPEWFRNMCVFGHFYITKPEQMQRRRNDILRVRKYLDMPILLETRDYLDYSKAGGDLPHFAPDPDRMLYLDELRSHDIRLIGYIDDRLWCTKDGPGRKYDWLFSKFGRPNQIVREDGSRPWEYYYSPSCAFAVMCPAAPFWQNWLIGECEDIARKARLDGIYHDQIMACAPISCFVPTHGHALSDPQAWVRDGYTPYLKEMRRRVARFAPDTIHSSEDGAEPYCAGQLDCCENWRWGYQQVPLFTSLYAGRYQFHGRILGDAHNPKADRGGFFAKLAEEVVWAEQIGAIMYGGKEEVNDGELMLFIKRMAHFRRALLPYLNESEFLRPPKFRRPVPDVAYVWNRAYGVGRVVKPQVRATAWQRQRDGARMAVFVNSENSPIEVEPILPGFGKSLVFVDGAEPVVVTDGAFKLNLGKRGIAVVVSGDEELLAAEKLRIGMVLKQIAGFTPPGAEKG